MDIGLDYQFDSETLFFVHRDGRVKTNKVLGKQTTQASMHKGNIDTKDGDPFYFH